MAKKANKKEERTVRTNFDSNKLVKQNPLDESEEIESMEEDFD